MRDIKDVLNHKEFEVQRLSEEIRILKMALPLLEDQPQQTEQQPSGDRAVINEVPKKKMWP